MKQTKSFPYQIQSKICALLSCLLIFIIGFYAQTSYRAFAQAPSLDEQKNILYVSAFTPSYTWDIKIVHYVRSILKDAGFEVQFYEEFLDLRNIERNAQEKIFNALNNLYTEKYQHTEFDLIIVNEEIDFMLTYGRKIFPNTPMLFCSLEKNTYNSLKHINNMSATIDIRNPIQVIKFLLATHPNVVNILVIKDNSIGSRVMIPQIHNIAKKYPSITFSYIHPADTKELASALKNLPPETILLDTSYFSSPPTGALLHDQRKAIAYELTGLPLFTVWNKAVDFGAIAGQDVSAEEHGKALGELAVTILQKGNASGVSPIFVDNSPLLVDYAMLLHFGLSENLIPEGATVINRPQSLYQKHRKIILIFALCVSLSLICIFSLLVALHQKRLEKKILLATLENQRKEQQIREQHLHTEKMEALAAFSGGIAHDISGILQVVSACSELIEEELAPHSISYQDIKKIQEMTQRGQGILQKITLCSIDNSKQQKKSKLFDELETILPLLRNTLPTTCQLHYKNVFQQAIVSLCPEEIFQIFQNLCNNAMQAMPSESGKIYIHINHAKMPTNKFRNIPPQEFVNITVRDTGAGIDPIHREHIFQPYYTTKKQQGHFGLGLFSLQNIIFTHHGTITVLNQEVKGTVFHIQLPCL